MKTDIYTENINFSYDKKELLLNGINLNIKKGEFTGILGPNGCGKSTLLKIILKYLFPQSGIVELQNKKAERLQAGGTFKNIEFCSSKIFSFHAYDRRRSGLYGQSALYEK